MLWRLLRSGDVFEHLLLFCIADNVKRCNIVDTAVIELFNSLDINLLSAE
jgi:hypothetical protein